MVPEDEVDEDKRATLRRFAAIGAAGPLVGTSGEQSDGDAESEVRGAIAGYLSTTPGAHFSKIRDDLRLGTGETQHHLRRLERRGLIDGYRDGDYHRYVLADRYDDFERRALGYLRRSTPRGMIVALLRRPSISASELAEALEVSRPTVSSYAAELEAAGLLGRDDGYRLRRPETLLMLLVRHAETFGPDAIELARESDTLVTYREK